MLLGLLLLLLLVLLSAYEWESAGFLLWVILLTTAAGRSAC
jgi:hypothetical protein